MITSVTAMLLESLASISARSRVLRGVHFPTAMMQPLPSPSPPLFTAFCPHPFLTRSRSIDPGKILELQMIAGEFQSILQCRHRHPFKQKGKFCPFPNFLISIPPPPDDFRDAFCVAGVPFDAPEGSGRPPLFSGLWSQP